MEDRVRLGQYVMATRKKLGYPERTDWAAAIGISTKTLGKVERGEHVGPSTLADIENFFGWAPGACQAIMRGGEPTLLNPSAEMPDASAVRPTADIKRELIAEWTHEEIERVGGMSLDDIEAEARVIGRFSGEDARLRYLHDAAVIKLQPSAPTSEKPGTLGR